MTKRISISSKGTVKSTDMGNKATVVTVMVKATAIVKATASNTTEATDNNMEDMVNNTEDMVVNLPMVAMDNLMEDTDINPTADMDTNQPMADTVTNPTVTVTVTSPNTAITTTNNPTDILPMVNPTDIKATEVMDTDMASNTTEDMVNLMATVINLPMVNKLTEDMVTKAMEVMATNNLMVDTVNKTIMTTNLTERV